jgi:hypothetical protein
MLKKEIKNNTKMVMYKIVYLPTLLYGSEIWTVLTGYESRVAGEEMRNCRQTRRDWIRKSQIWGILNEVLVTEMVNRRERKWFGHLIKMDNNRKCRNLWERWVVGEKEGWGWNGWWPCESWWGKKRRPCGMRLGWCRTGECSGLAWWKSMSERETRGYVLRCVHKYVCAYD